MFSELDEDGSGELTMDEIAARQTRKRARRARETCPRFLFFFFFFVKGPFCLRGKQKKRKPKGNREFLEGHVLVRETKGKPKGPLVLGVPSKNTQIHVVVARLL